MTDTTSISTAQLQAMRTQVLNQGKAGAIAVYNQLQRAGYNYAGWAYGVVSGTSITGRAAVDFLKTSAMFGVGINYCANLSEDQVENVFKSMAVGYLDTLIDIAAGSGGSVSRDVTYAQTRAFHESAFVSNKLSISNWTLETPMKLLTNWIGASKAEEFYTKLRDTGGTYLDSWAASSILYGVAKITSVTGDASSRALAEEWLANTITSMDTATSWIVNANWSTLQSLLYDIESFLNATPTPSGGTSSYNFNLWGSLSNGDGAMEDEEQSYIREARELYLAENPDREPISVFNSDWDMAQSLGYCDNTAAEWDYPSGDHYIAVAGEDVATFSVLGRNGDAPMAGDARFAGFDMDGNGYADNTAWVLPDRGMLFLGNESTTVSNATQLYDAQELRSLDTNSDTILDQNDSAWSELRVWVDFVEAGKFNVGESFSMGDLGIERINLGIDYIGGGVLWGQIIPTYIRAYTAEVVWDTGNRQMMNSGTNYYMPDGMAGSNPKYYAVLAN